MDNLRKLVMVCGVTFAATSGCGDDGGGGEVSVDASSPGVDAAELPDAAIPDASPPDAAIAPPLRNPVDSTDDVLATQALQLLGSPGSGNPENCENCHGLTRQYLRYWRALSDQSITACLTDVEVSTPEIALEMVDCLRMIPDDTATPFVTSKLGVYSAAAHLDWFQFVFHRAYGDSWEAEYTEFTDRVAMPRGNDAPFTQEQFDVVAEWFARGLPRMDDMLPNDPPPNSCLPGVSGDVATHVAEMATSGWRATNEENNLLMFGCAGVTTRKCLSGYPRASELPIGAGWEAMPDTKLLILAQEPNSTAYWTRSSADGRYVAYGSGSGGGSTMIDLFDGRFIGVSALYDPAFFPDNSGFVFQALGAKFCDHSLLASAPNQITFAEPECNSTTAVGLYEHLGAALGGGDHWAVDSQFVSDNGGHSFTGGDPSAYFGPSAKVDLTPLVHQGLHYLPGTKTTVDTPFEGDAVISASARLLITRVAGPGDQQLGYVLRKVVATPGPSGYLVDTPEIARYCLNGGKPAFSYDERWMVIHNYVDAADAVDLGYTGPGDPGFQPYLSQGAANVYVVDLLDGQRHRVTRMHPGQYALFPHFRSDGWIYFTVRTLGGDEYVVASDAALELDGTP